MGTPTSRAVALFISFTLVSGASTAFAGKSGFADKPGGGVNDPVIEVAASIAPDQGAVFSLTENQANDQYRFNPLTGQFNILPGGALALPAIPPMAGGANQFIRIRFPIKISSKKARKSIMNVSADTIATSFLTSNVQITDQNGNHIPGIPVVNGKGVFGNSLVSNLGFPQWLDADGKNQLTGKKVFAYIATLGTDQDLSSIAAFGASPGTPENVGASINEIRVRINEINKITMNGFWVLKIGDGVGGLKNAGALTIDSVTANSPVTPAATMNGNQVVQASTRFVIHFSEPVVPQSVGFNAKVVAKFNAANPVVPLVYNANSAFVPNPFNLLVPYFPNVVINATPNAVSTFPVPYDVHPINPNNLAEYVVDPIVELPGAVNVSVTAKRTANNANPTSDPANPTVTSAATSLYNVLFNNVPTQTTTFYTTGVKAFTNVPVSPQVLYYVPLNGTGVGAINLSGQGYETNDPSTSRILLLTNLLQLSACATSVILPGSYQFGCNPNTFGDFNAVTPIGLGGNLTGHLGGPTPVPGVNEGSTGFAANGDNPNGIFPAGFESVARDSNGNPRLAHSPAVNSVGEVAVGDFLDTLFFDTLNPFAGVGLHASLTQGTAMNRNSISDPPMPNPPPLRLPVGLPPVDIVYSQQNLLKPSFVIEGDEVFTGIGPPRGRIYLRPNPNAFLGDTLPTFGQNGPAYQTFTAGAVQYASRQQIGNFLYVTDRDDSALKVLNSNTFNVVDSIKLPDPEGVTMSPDLKRVYVTNYGDDTLSIIGADPYAPLFHQEINRIKVGNGPRVVRAQSDGEDIFVCNYVGGSISIVSPQTQTIRKTLSDANLKKPWDIILTPRQILSGWTSGIYFGFIGSLTSQQILIYESGPSGVTGVGSDSVRWAVDDPIHDIRGMCYDPGSFPGAQAGLAGGAYVAHRDLDTGLAMVSRAVFFFQAPLPGPFPPSTLNINQTPFGPLQRIFKVVATWGGPLVSASQKLNNGGNDQQAFDVALADFRTNDFYSTSPQLVQTNFGALTGLNSLTAQSFNNKSPLRIIMGAPLQTNFTDRLYISFPGDNTIEVVDPDSAGIRLNKITGAPSVGRLTSFFD